MILDELVLHNFGVYRGQHRTLLTPPAERPIILFGALNGSGKTTFMEAMQLALYGRAIASRGRHAYHDYLARSVNRYVSPETGAGLELAFRYWMDGNLQPIRLKRTWHQSGKAMKEVFEVWRNGVLDTVATERWAEFVEEIIPNQISHLFFFDGEKIEGLADPTQSADLLRVGLHSLLGLDLVDHLVRSLGVVERRCKGAQLDAPDRAVLDRIDGEIAALEKTRTDLGQQIAETNSKIDQRCNEVSRLDKQLEHAGGHLFGRRKDLESQHEQLGREREQISRDLLALAAGDAPLLLVAPLLTELETVVITNLKEASDALLSEHIEQRDNQLLDKMSEFGVRARHVEMMRKYLQSTKLVTPPSKSEPLPISLGPASLLSQTEIRIIRDSLAQQLERLGYVDERIDACQRNLHAVPEEDAVRAPLEALRTAQQELERLNIRVIVLKEEQEKIAAELLRREGQRRAKLEQVADYQLATATTQRIVKHSARARATLGNYREEIAQRHMVRVEKLITQSFAQLHRKKSLRHSISIERETYELHLMEEGGHQIDASELSAGERQLLAVSVLWALAQASGRRLPTVIDTPLGRLDGPHRHFLVDNYFPYASHQVILFSTDEEVTPTYYRRLAPAIGREYSIVFDEAKRSSVILDGYLKETVLAA